MVHIHFEVCDIVFADERADGVADVFERVFPGEIELRRAVAENPFRTFGPETALRNDDFEFHPETELHAVGFDAFGDLLESVGKVFRMNRPVPDVGLPAVVDDEEFASDFGGFGDEVENSLFGEFCAADAGECVEDDGAGTLRPVF